MRNRKYPNSFGRAREDILGGEILWNVSSGTIWINSKIKFFPWQKKKLMFQLSGLLFRVTPVSYPKTTSAGELIRLQ